MPESVDIVGSRPGTSLEHVNIVVIREFQGAIWSRFSGSAEIGFNFTKASESTQLNLSTDLGYNAEYVETSISYD